MNMNFGKAFGVVLLGVLSGVAAHAQAGVYVGYSASKLTGIQCLVPSTSVQSSSPGTCTNGTAGYTLSNSTNAYSTGNVSPSGLMFGAYYDFKTIGRVRLGGDFRFVDMHDKKSAAAALGGIDATNSRMLLFGLRASTHTPIKWLIPYGEVALGRNSTDATEAVTTTGGTGTPRQFDSFLQYSAFAGADIRIAPVVDLRVIELGIGNANRLGSGQGASSSSFGVQTISAGVVFHLPR